jgi:hypothetical protein
MKIYTEVVWSWDDEKGELVRESSKSYDYEGPLTLFNDYSVESTIAANKLDTRTFTYPKDTNPGLPHYIRFVALRAYTSSAQAKRGTPNGEVVLYMPPDALKTSYTQAIGDVEMGGFIKLAGSAGGIGSELAGGEFGAAGATGAAAFNAITGKITGENVMNVMKGMGKAAVGGALKKFAGTAGGQAVSRATGQILNPHKAVVYQGPGNFRTFSFTFVLVPKSAGEAKEIWEIVRFFKKRMHPGTGAGTGINSVSSVTLTYPDEFEIQYNVNGKPVDGKDVTKPLFKIHNCFMESFAADYTTSGVVSFLDDDQPVTTTISMSFKETQLLTKKDIDEGY